MNANPFLLPCPFCDGAAVFARLISPEGVQRGDRPSFDISCDGCWVWGRWDSQDAAIEAWNARPLPTSSEPPPAKRDSAPLPLSAESSAAMRDALRRVQLWINTCVPIGTEAATTMLGVVNDALNKAEAP